MKSETEKQDVKQSGKQVEADNPPMELEPLEALELLEQPIEPFVFGQGCPPVPINPENALRALKASTGAKEIDFGTDILTRAIGAANTELNTESSQMSTNMISAAMFDLKPKYGFEGMLCAQMVTVFRQAMHCFCKSNIGSLVVRFGHIRSCSMTSTPHR